MRSSECQGQALLLLPASGCVTQELPREDQWVSLPGQVVGRTDRAHLCLRHLLPGAEASPHPKGAQGTQQEGQAWRWGQLSAGCWGKGSRAPPRALRASMSPVGVRGEHGVRPWPWQRE